ncbi:MAG: hypothetical protein QM731_28105 [Chitinophagaceae bacterium]
MTRTENSQAITVKRIKLLSFNIEEESLINLTSIIKFEIDASLAFALDENLVNLTLRLHYQPEDKESILTDITVQNLYEIPDLQQFVTNETEIKLPSLLISTITGISISHTRALFALNVSGTLLQDKLPAVINPETVARHFFPNMFEVEKKIR